MTHLLQQPILSPGAVVLAWPPRRSALTTPASPSLASDHKQALQISETLERAFKIRNETVHGAQHCTGMETVKLQGREVLSQHIFWDVRRIVAGLIRVAIFKLNRTEGMRYLRITAHDTIEQVLGKTRAK